MNDFGFMAGVAAIILACYIGSGINIYLKYISHYQPKESTECGKS